MRTLARRWLLSRFAFMTLLCMFRFGVLGAAATALLLIPGHPVAARAPQSDHELASSVFTGARLGNPGFQLPQLLTNARGDAVELWKSTPSASAAANRTYVSVNPNGTAWSAARQIQPAGTDGRASFVGLGGQGRAVILWSTSTHMYWQQFRPGQGFGLVRTVPGASGQTPQSFFMSTSGWAVVSWVRGGVGYVQIQRPKGIWLRLPIRVTEPNTRGQQFGAPRIDVSIGSNGAVTATWLWLTDQNESGSYGQFELGGLTYRQNRKPRRVLATNQFSGDGGIHLEASASGNSQVLRWHDDSKVAQLRLRLNGHVWVAHTLHMQRVGGSVAIALAEVPRSLSIGLTDNRVAIWFDDSFDYHAYHVAVTDYANGSWTAPVRLATYRVPDPNHDNRFGIDGSIAPGGARIVTWHESSSYPQDPMTTIVRTTQHGTVTTRTLGARTTTWATSARGRPSVSWTDYGAQPQGTNHQQLWVSPGNDRTSPTNGR